MRRASGYTEEQNYQDALKLAELFERIATCKPIVIAKVNGHAFGGGAGIVACCDVAVSADKALFSFSEVKLGLIAATISRFVVPKIGQGHARALFSTGDIFGADHALRIGLVHEVGPKEDLDEMVTKKLKAILAAGPESAYASKMLAQNPFLDPSTGARALAERRSTPEAQEGIAAFLEKRKASFVVEP
jgi:enoyl-CoA hydratase/carnithine racemase